MRKYVIDNMSRLIHSEIHTMCSDKIKSVLLSQLTDTFAEFSWDLLIKEMEVHAPVLLSLNQNQGITVQQRSHHRDLYFYSFEISL